MRLPILLGSMLLIAATGFCNVAHAQGIKLGKLKQLTAPFVAGNIELLAIGYDGDTVESTEKPSLFGFSGHIDLGGSTSEMNLAWVATVKPNADCLNCELREESETIPAEEQFAELRKH